ncbi:hypothetical protein D3C72_1930810 [compost metagenome]
MGVFSLITLLYFSGIAKVIFTELSLTKFAISVLDETIAPTEIFLKPIIPLNGARTVVLEICAWISWICACEVLSAALAISNSS